MKAEKSQGLPQEEERRTQIALFRYALIAPLLNRPLERGEIAAHLKAVAAQTHRIPYCKRSTLMWNLAKPERRRGFVHSFLPFLVHRPVIYSDCPRRPAAPGPATTPPIFIVGPSGTRR